MERHVPYRTLGCMLLFVTLFVLGACSESHHGDSPSPRASGSSNATPGTGNTNGASPRPLRAGAAAIDITPGAGVPLGGFGGAPRRQITLSSIPLHLSAVAGSCFDPDPSTPFTLFEPAQGVHDPIMARALVIERDGRRFALLGLDLIGINAEFRTEISAYARTLGIEARDLMISATHTHSGPGALTRMMLWQLIALDCFHRATYERVLEGSKRALREAIARLEPARIGIGVGRESRVSRNRRHRPAFVDHELALIKVERPDGSALAAVINFAVHGTALGAGNMLFSADLMGYAERALERRLGGGTALFVNAAEGDVAPVLSGFGGARHMGEQIAETAAVLWANTTSTARIHMDASLEYVTLPQPVINTGCVPVPGTNTDLCALIPGFSLAIALDPSWLPNAVPFQAWRVGDDVIATVPGEPITEVGTAIKAAGRALGYRHVLIAGLANDYMGYVATFDQVLAGSYEGQSTLYGPQTASLVIEAARRRMRALR